MLDPKPLSDEELVVSYLEGVYFKKDLPRDFFEDLKGKGSTFDKVKPDDNKFSKDKVKMFTTQREVKLILKSAENWVAGQLGFMEYSDINPTGSVVKEAKILYAAARLYCKKLRDSDQKKEVAYPTTCLKEHDLFQGALEILKNWKEDDKEYINEKLVGWI